MVRIISSFCLYALFAFMFAPVAQGQKADSLRQRMVRIKPLHLFNAGLYADYAWRQAPYRWISTGVELYYRDKPQADFPYIGNYAFTQLRGLGVHGGYEVFFFNARKKHRWQPEGSYMRAEVMLRNFYTGFKDDFGLPYKQTSYTAGFNVVLGHQLMAGDYMFVGGFGGLGIRKAWHFAEDGPVRPMSDAAWEYGFSGVVLLLGIEVGGWF